MANPKVLIHATPITTLRLPERSFPPIAGGLPAPPQEPPEEVTRREDITFGSGERVSFPIPGWFQDLAARRASAEEVVSAVVQHLSEINDLRQAVLLANEIGRLDGGAAALLRVLTKELIDSLRSRR